MHRLLRLLSVWLIVSAASPLWAACPSRTYTYATGQTIDPGQVTTNEDSLFTYGCAVDTFAVGAVDAAAIADNAVGTGEIADGVIVNADVSATAAIAGSKLAGPINTATALAANGANCAAGNYPLGVDAAGASESCTAVSSPAAPFVGSFTRDTTVASGTQAVTGVGFQPSAVIFFMAQGSATEMSIGLDSGTTSLAVYDTFPDAADTYGISTTLSIFDFQAGGTFYQGEVTSLGTDGFTITWTRTGAPAGTLTINYMAFD